MSLLWLFLRLILLAGFKLFGLSRLEFKLVLVISRVAVYIHVA